MRKRPHVPILKRVLRGTWKLSKRLFFLAILGVVGLYGYVRYDFTSAANNLDSHVARAKELGLPLDPADMQRHPPLDPSENAAPFYRQMSYTFERLGKPLDEKERIEAHEAAVRPDAAGLDLSRAAIRKLDVPIRLARQAASRPHVDFERDWSLGPSLLFPQFTRQKEAAKWLVTRALVSLRSGDRDFGFEDLAAAGRIAAHAGEDKILVGGLVNIAIDAITIAGIETAASYEADNPSSLRALKATISSLPPVPEFEEYLKGEVFFGYTTSRNLYRHWMESKRSIEENGYSDGRGVEEWRMFPPLIGRDLAERAYASRCLEFWNECFAMRRSGARFYGEGGDHLDLLAHNRFGNSYRPTDYLGAILFPVFAQAEMAFEKMKVNRLMSLAMIDLLLYKDRHGRFPKNLDQAGIKITDPFDKKPIKYKLTKTGFRIYSAGFNRQDDGGFFAWERTAQNKAGRDEPIAAHPAWERLRPNTKS